MVVSHYQLSPQSLQSHEHCRTGSAGESGGSHQPALVRQLHVPGVSMPGGGGTIHREEYIAGLPLILLIDLVSDVHNGGDDVRVVLLLSCEHDGCQHS